MAVLWQAFPQEVEIKRILVQDWQEVAELDAVVIKDREGLIGDG